MSTNRRALNVVTGKRLIYQYDRIGLISRTWTWFSWCLCNTVNYTSKIKSHLTRTTSYNREYILQTCNKLQIFSPGNDPPNIMLKRWWTVYLVASIVYLNQKQSSLFTKYHFPLFIIFRWVNPGKADRYGLFCCFDYMKKAIIWKVNAFFLPLKHCNDSSWYKNMQITWDLSNITTINDFHVITLITRFIVSNFFVNKIQHNYTNYILYFTSSFITCTLDCFKNVSSNEMEQKTRLFCKYISYHMIKYNYIILYYCRWVKYKILVLNQRSDKTLNRMKY